MSINLRTYFILIFSIFIIIFTTAISFIINKESSERAQEQISEALTEEAYEMANQLDYFMWARYGEVQILSTLDTLQQQDNEDEISELLNELKSNFPSFSWIGYTDSSGNVIAATDDILVGADISKRPVFTEAQEKTFIGDVHKAVLLSELLPNPNGEPLQFVDISSPIFNENNEFIGVLAAHLSWEWAKEVKRLVIQPIKQNEKELEVFIVSKKDNTILLGPNDMIGQKLQLSAVTKAQSGENSWSLDQWPDGKQYLTGYALADGVLNYSGLDWTVLVRQPTEVAFESVKELRNNVIMLGFLSFILFAVVGWYFASIISNPLRQLAKTAEKLKNGERVEIPINRTIRDIETLSTSLKELIKALTKTKSDLGRMELKAQLDNLTGLPNRLALDDYLKDVINHPIENEHKHYAFLYLDLDGFKSVNDKYGHHHGDELLKEVAVRLKSCIRASEFLCRLGGDEFVIILKINTVNDSNEIDIVGKRILDSLNEPFYIEGSQIKIGCSIGVSLYPTDDTDSYKVLRYADKALYNSKREGKGQLSYYKE